MSETCEFCDKCAPYTCPSCSKPYCSVVCYKSQQHRTCSEQFYRRCVLETVSKCDPSAEIRQKVQSMLSEESAGLKEDEDEGEDGDGDDDSDDEQELADRLRGVDLEDSEKVWSVLTEEEREEFRQQADRDQIAVESWTPWWSVRHRRPLVSEVGADRPAYLPSLPPLLVDVAPLSSMMRRQPSPGVFYTLVSLLYAYGSVQLLLDGSWRGRELLASRALSHICRSLSGRAPPGSVSDAIEDVDARAAGTDWQLEADQQRQARHAVQQILVGPNRQDQLLYTLAALSDVWRVLRTARSAVPVHPAASTYSLPFSSNAGDSLDRRALRLMGKKVEFLFSWSRANAELIRTRVSKTEDSEIILPTVNT